MQTYLSVFLELVVFRPINPSYFRASVCICSSLRNFLTSSCSSQIRLFNCLAWFDWLALSFARRSAYLSCISVADTRSLSWTRLTTRSRCKSFSLSSSRLDFAFCRCLKKRFPSRLAWNDFCLPMALDSRGLWEEDAVACWCCSFLVVWVELRGFAGCWSALLSWY